MNLDYIHAFVVMKPKGSKKGNQFGHLSHTTKSSQAGKGPTEKKPHTIPPYDSGSSNNGLKQSLRTYHVFSKLIRRA